MATLNVQGLPTVALQPGSTDTTNVTALQKFLVANGYLTQQQMDTGPGIYGPQTTAAVKKLQEDYGVDNSTGVGYFGPRTLAAVQTASAAPAVSSTAATPGGTTTPSTTTTATSAAPNLKPQGAGPGITAEAANFIPISQLTGYTLPASGSIVIANGQPYQVNGGFLVPFTGYSAQQAAQYGAKDISSYAPGAQNTATTASDGLVYDSKYGVDQSTWNQMNDTQKATIAAAYTAKQAAYTNNGQQLTFADALKQAAQDPNILAQFSDAAKIDKNTFTQTLQQTQQAATDEGQQRQQQFENERKNLAEQQAAAGTAYSGFRGEAQKQLGTTESGIVQSSRSTLQKNLNDLTQSFEQKYGTSATTPATASFTDPYASSNTSLSGLYNPSAPTTSALSGSTVGGITGTQPIAQSNAVNAKATDLYNLANTTPTVS